MASLFDALMQPTIAIASRSMNSFFMGKKIGAACVACQEKRYSQLQLASVPYDKLEVVERQRKRPNSLSGGVIWDGKDGNPQSMIY